MKLVKDRCMAYLLIILIVFFATCIGTCTGFGMGTLTLPLLMFFFPAQQALFLVAILHGAMNLWRMILFRRGLAWRLIALFGIPALIGSFFGALLVVHIDPMLLARILGVFLIVYVIMLSTHPHMHLPQNVVTASFGGALSGFSGGLIGMQGALRAAFLRGYNLKKDVYLAVSAAVGIIVDIVRTIKYWHSGITLPVPAWYVWVILLPTTYIAAYTGQLLVKKVSHERFMMWISIALALIGLKLIIAP